MISRAIIHTSHRGWGRVFFPTCQNPSVIGYSRASSPCRPMRSFTCHHTGGETGASSQQLSPSHSDLPHPSHEKWRDESIFGPGYVGYPGNRDCDQGGTHEAFVVRDLLDSSAISMTCVMTSGGCFVSDAAIPWIIDHMVSVPPFIDTTLYQIGGCRLLQVV